MITTIEKKKRPAKILLVEDNRGDAVLAARAFKNIATPLYLYTADSAEQALALLHKEGEYEIYPTPDIILLDLNLPKMHGHEFLKIIKDDRQLKHIPVIILSSSRAKQDVVDSYQSFANGYLVKPIELEQFDEMVRSLDQLFFKTMAMPDSDDVESCGVAV